MTAAEKIGPIMEVLDRQYPDAHVTLDFTNPLEMLVATVLSAQCTDVRVNEVTPALFAKYRSAADYAQAPLEELEEMIRSTGFFRNKAKSIKGFCQKLVEKYDGKVPDSLDELVKLPGVGRKTANVVLGNAFGIPGIFVDTHLGRVSQRLGLTKEKDPVKIEFDLMPLVPKDHWVKFSHQMIQHGRQICHARNPKCSICPLLPYCDFGQKTQAGAKRS
jgi:endonuclease-3